MKMMNKVLQNDQAHLFVGIYGILAQIIAIPAIYFLSRYVQAESAETTATTLIYLWYLFPIFALLPLTLAILQVRQRKSEGLTFKKPLAGLIVNMIWILANIVFLAAGFGF